MANSGSLVAPDLAGGSNGREPGPRPLVRRRSLPNGRALAGGLLVAAAAVGLFAAYARLDAGPRHAYVVVRHDAAAGERLGAADLALEPMDLPASLAARAFGSVADLDGATLVSPLAAGELVQPSAVVATRAGTAARVVSFPVERGHLPALSRGEQVDVVATFGSGADAYTVVVLHQAPVVEVERSTSSMGDTAPVVLAVAVDSPADEVALAHAVQVAKLMVVAATGAPSTPPAPPYRPAGPSPGKGT